MNSEKKISLCVLILILFSFLFLSYAEQKRTSPTKGNGWWTIYFENPKSQELTFVIENNGKAKKLHWKEILQNSDTPLKEAAVLVPAGQKITIPLASVVTLRKEKVIIEVSAENGEREELYKLLD